MSDKSGGGGGERRGGGLFLTTPTPPMGGTDLEGGEGGNSHHPHQHYLPATATPSKEAGGQQPLVARPPGNDRTAAVAWAVEGHDRSCVEAGPGSSFHSSQPSTYSRITGAGVQGGTVSSGTSSISSSSTTGGSAFGPRKQGGQTWLGGVGGGPGEFYHHRPGLTHQSVGLTLAHDPSANIEDTWDLSDSLADLFQQVNQKRNCGKHGGIPESVGELGIATTSSAITPTSATQHWMGSASETEDTWKNVDVERWISDDTSHGFIRVSSSEGIGNSRLFPCTLSTTAQKICLQLGIPHNSLHVQLNGDIIRRMEPFDCPLAVQNEYLSSIGYSHVRRVQEEGHKEDLAYLVKFYSGKPVSDSTYSRNQLSSWVYVRKGKLLHQWVRRLCVISGTRLLMYRDKGDKPHVVQLAKGSVEEVQVKGQEHVLKLTSTLQGEKSLFVSFTSQSDYIKWLKKTKKATSKLPTKADLSGCHLEFLPETVFINEDLQMLVLRHNVLRERPIEEDIYTIGWLDDLPRFQALRSLNLADNDLRVFPLALCLLRTLVELNLASNKLEDVPPQIAELVNLQALHLHNNQLSSLPEEVSTMKQLAVLVLAFNNFTHIPYVLLHSQHTHSVDSIIMAGNQVSRLPLDMLPFMGHIKKVDLRKNRLQLLPTETAKFHALEHVTHIDIRDNNVVDLDIRAVRFLEYLNCDRNSLKSLQVNGTSLKNLFASHNKLEMLSVNPKPEWLNSMEVSHNKLSSLPNWIGECFFLVRLDVSHNCLTQLSDKLFTEARKLRVLKANHNKLNSLPTTVQKCVLEELYLEHNEIRSLSPQLFIQANRLRVLNLTRNKLCDLPAPHPNDSFNKIQELYLSFNNLGNAALNKLCCFPRMRVLHLAANKISVIEERDLEKLEQLLELNVSGNLLAYLPACVGRHPQLQVLRANCCLLQELPSFKNSSALKVLEVSSNHLHNVSMSNLMTSQVNLLDISGNPNLAVSSHDLDSVKKSKRLCMVDMRGQNWSLQDLCTVEDPLVTRPWLSGLSQTSGIRNKLSVMVVNKPALSDQGDALFAVVDGGRNEEVAKALADSLVTTLQSELTHTHTQQDYMKYTMLTAHRQLKSLGEKLGAAAAIVHISRSSSSNKRHHHHHSPSSTSTRPNSKKGGSGNTDSLGRGEWMIHVANVGDTEVVLCHHGRIIPLTRRFDVTDDGEECSRVIKSGGIITEDGRVNGVTFNTRLLGCSYLYPNLIPHPHTSSRPLTQSDRFLILANQGLWRVVTHEEAVKEIREINDPVVAAKRLQDLAQGYGSRENIAVVVVRLMLSESERLRVQESLSSHRESQRELLRVLSQRSDLLELRDGVPSTPELSNVVIDRSGRAKKSGGLGRSYGSGSSLKSKLSESSSLEGGEKKQQEPEKSSRTQTSSKLYRKKETPATNMLESVLSKRLADEVKSEELRHAFLADEDEEEEARKNVIDFSNEVPPDNLYSETKYSTVSGRVGMGKISSPPPRRRAVPPPPLDLVHSCDVMTPPKPPVPPPRPSATTKPKPSSYSSSNPSRSNRPQKPPPPPPSSPPPPPLPPPPRPPPPREEVPMLRANVPFVYPSDSLVSLDNFKKEVVRGLNIDRDAILFHQMQLARVQNRGSNASLTSIQSDPQYACSMRDVFSPALPASSRSIEVLVHSDQNLQEDEDLHSLEDVHYQHPDFEDGIFDCHYIDIDNEYDDENVDDSSSYHHSSSSDPLMEVEIVDSTKVPMDELYNPLRNRRSQMNITKSIVMGSSQTNMWSGEEEGGTMKQGEEHQNPSSDSDDDTLVDEMEEAWFVDSEESQLLPSSEGSSEDAPQENWKFRSGQKVEELYATVKKKTLKDGGSPSNSQNHLASHHSGFPDQQNLSLVGDSRMPQDLICDSTVLPPPPLPPDPSVVPPHSFLPPPHLPSPPPLPPPPALFPMLPSTQSASTLSSSDFLPTAAASRLSHQRSIIITYL